jgi:type IV pilus assembly protein PilB
MNENASLALSATRSGLGGLPQRLVQDGVVDETGMRAALQSASEKRTSFVTQLIAAGSATARDIAVAAATEYGVPLFDLNSLAVDLDTVMTVTD